MKRILALTYWLVAFPAACWWVAWSPAKSCPGRYDLWDGCQVQAVSHYGQVVWVPEAAAVRMAAEEAAKARFVAQQKPAAPQPARRRVRRAK